MSAEAAENQTPVAMNFGDTSIHLNRCSREKFNFRLGHDFSLKAVSAKAGPAQRISFSMTRQQ
jgi:hypothetical protein